MQFISFDKMMSAVKDYHVPALLAMFAAGGILHWFHRLDVAFVSFTGVIVGGLTGHAFSPAQKDHDHDDNH
jgi:hypothetical protein